LLKTLTGEQTSVAFGLSLSLAFLLSFLIPDLRLVRFAAGAIILLFVLGHLLRCFARVVLRRPSTVRLWSPPGIALDLLASFGITITIAAALMINFAMYEEVFVGLVLGLVVGSGLATLLTTFLATRRRPPEIETSRATGRVPILSAVASLVALSVGIFALFTRLTPYPSTRGWDLNATLATVSWAIEHHGFPYLLIPPFPETAVLPYPASLTQAIVSFSLFLGAPPDAIFYYGIIPILVLYACGVFGVAYKLSGRLLPSLLSGYSGLFLGTTNIQTVRTPVFLTVDMIGQLIFIAMILFYLGDEHGKARRWAILVLASAFLLYFYFYTIFVAGPVLVFMLTEPLIFKDARARRRVFDVALVSVLLGSIVGSVSIQVLVPGAELDPLFGFPTEMKIFVLSAIYPAEFVALLFVALASRWKHRQIQDVRGFDFPLLAEYAVFYGILFFLPLWAIYRVEFYLRLALVLMIAGMTIPPWRQVKPSFGSLTVKHVGALLRASGPERRFLIQMAVAIIAVAIMLLSIPAGLELRDAYVSVDEYETARWIQSHTTSDVYIITDPGTGYVLRGYSLRNASTFFILPDGRAPALSSSVYPSLPNDLHGVFTAQSPQEAWNRTLGLGFSQPLVLVSSRTVIWTREDPSAIFTGPIPEASFGPLLRLFVPPHFALQFSTPTTYVFSVSP
jgi:hypothetical protein